MRARVFCRGYCAFITPGMTAIYDLLEAPSKMFPLSLARVPFPAAFRSLSLSRALVSFSPSYVGTDELENELTAVELPPLSFSLARSGGIRSSSSSSSFSRLLLLASSCCSISLLLLLQRRCALSAPVFAARRPSHPTLIKFETKSAREQPRMATNWFQHTPQPRFCRPRNYSLSSR